MTAAEKLIVEIEGRKIPVERELAGDDDMLKRAFSSLFSWAAEARVDRSKEAEEGIVKLVKAAGTKGRRSNSPAEHLCRVKGGKNPVIELYERLAGLPLGQLDASQVLKLEKRVRKVVEEGEEHLDAVREAGERLKNSTPRPSPFVPMGF